MKMPVISVEQAAQQLGISYNKTNKLFRTCEDMGIIRQITVGKRNRRFVYSQYLQILNEGTELIGVTKNIPKNDTITKAAAPNQGSPYA
jgi:DNA-binding Lrp family transcriptional regulator